LRLKAIPFFVLAAWVLPTLTSFGAEKNQACGPPNYCARTDRRVEPYPANPPAIGPAGSIITDPSFGSRIIRVTDAKSDPQGRGRSLLTPSSAEQNAWNANGTKFYVLTPGGQYLLYNFDPSGLKVHQQGMIRVSWVGEPEFSYTQPDILYGTTGSDPVLQQYDTGSGKIASCVQLRPTDLGHSVVVSHDDRRIGTMVGPAQDRNPLVYIFDRKQGCRWYNTQTGEIGGQWGPKGTISIPDRYLIHNLRMSKSGEFVWIQRGVNMVGRDWLVWNVATMDVLSCPAQCSGHHAMGYSHLIGPSGQKHPMDVLVRPLNQLSATTRLIADLQPTTSDRYWFDQHYSWNNADSDDTNPVCLSTYSGSNPAVPGAPLDTIAPWENEILCIQTDGKASQVWRFAHTYSTAKNGFWSTPRGNVSQDGRFFMFTSDWQDQLDDGLRDRNNHRMDVFIVELR
jgi:hypothetical protein